MNRRSASLPIVMPHRRTVRQALADASITGWSIMPFSTPTTADPPRYARPDYDTQDLEQRVTRVAEAVLAEQRFVSAIDVLIGLGWLAPSHVDRWRQGRVESLEQVMQVNPSKITAAMAAFERWAQDQGLKPSETDYIARTRDRRQLRFSASGDAATERAYRTHWVSPDLPERAVERQSRPPELVVISPVKEWTCASCGDTGDLLFMEDAGPLCLDCADLGHLVFLPAGDAALTRRAKKASRLSAVVVRWSRSRKRYERQGILAEAEAIERAEQECLSDAEAARPPQGARPGSTGRRGRAFPGKACRRDPRAVSGLPGRPGRGDRPSCGGARQWPDRTQRGRAGPGPRRRTPRRRSVSPAHRHPIRRVAHVGRRPRNGSRPGARSR